VLATGSRVPRDLPAQGRELHGVHFAMEYLYERNRWVARGGDSASAPLQPDGKPITAAGKHVVVIGGGDTGADCVGNALREEAASIVQLELLPEPPHQRPDALTPWPLWPLKYRLSYAMEEALRAGVGEQDFSASTVCFQPHPERRDNVGSLTIAQAQPQPPFAPVPGTEQELPAELVLLAMGFLGPEQQLLEQLQVERDERSNVKAVEPYRTSVDGVFAAGDARRGQSLIVWAINEGRQCAAAVERYLERLDDPALAAEHDSPADADSGPEGPPRHVGPGVPAG
jgi:glutamate synthase (NADPH) small chain